MAVIIGFLDLSVDIGQVRYARRNLQLAADAAAVAAAMELKSCAGTTNCSVTQAATQTNCSSTAATGLVLSLNNPACALGTADPDHSNNAYVEVVMTQPQTTYFARIFSVNRVPLAARTEVASSLVEAAALLVPQKSMRDK
jgi:uncharacterized membrane protein